MLEDKRKYVVYLFQLFLILTAFFIPVNIRLVTPLVVFSSLCWITQINLHIFKKKLLKNRLGVLLIVYYALHIVGLLYTEHKGSGYFDLEVKMSLFAFPLLLFTWNYPIKKLIKKVSIAFGAGVLVAICMNIYQVSIEYDNFFEGLNKSRFSFTMHYGYFSYYMNLLLTLAFAGMVRVAFSFKRSIIYIALSVFISFCIVLTSSKMGFILLVINWTGFGLLLLFYYKRIPYGMALLAVLLSIGIYANSYLKNSVLFQRTLFEYSNLNNEKTDYKNTDASTMRVLAWNASLDIFSEGSILGTGSGDVKHELFEYYKNEGYEKNLKKHINAHNQYLETLVGIGIPGLILLLSIVTLLFISSFKPLNWLMISFIIQFALTSSVESVLMTNKGIVYFLLFFCLFYEYQLSQKPNVNLNK